MPFVPIERLRSQWQELPQESRFAIGVLGIAGISVLAFSFAFLRQQVLSPFTISVKRVRESSQEYNKLLAQNNQQLEQRKIDTDKDGLNDYSEIYIYKTSAYIADTDSDGMPDAIEIAQGMDPNCPKGQQCLQALNTGRITTSTNEDLTIGASSPVEEFILSAPDPATVNTQQKKEYLLKTGYVTTEDLAALPDLQINELYQSAYNEVLNIRKSLNTINTSTSPLPALSTTPTQP